MNDLFKSFKTTQDKVFFGFKVSALVLCLICFSCQFWPNITVSGTSVKGVSFLDGFVPGYLAVYGGSYGSVSLLGNFSFNTGAFIGYFSFLIAIVLICLSIFDFKFKKENMKKLFLILALFFILLGTVLLFCSVPLFVSANALEWGKYKSTLLLSYGPIVGGTFGIVSFILLSLIFFIPFAKKH